MSRWRELAEHLATVNEVGQGTKVSVFATTSSVLDAVDAFVEEVYRRGGVPQVLLAEERYDRHALAHASEEVLRAAAPLELASMEWADVHVSFRGMEPPAAEIDGARLSLQREGKGVVSTARWQGTRWTLVRIPTPEWAALVGVPQTQLEQEFFAGTLADWPAHRAHLDRLCAELDTVSTVRILDEDTDLRLNCAGRTWVPFAGEANLPDGEVATAPVEDGVDGHITFPGTFWFGGATITDLRLEFEAGRVERVSATRGLDLVERILEADGARRVGELGIGTNPHVQTMTGDLLIDEKILGTVHIALGRSYPQCGGKNESAIHWDIVKDLRPSGRLEADARVLIDRTTYDPLLAGQES
ncbi:aminopeptidase [Microbacterium sp. p3-SID336]|uniref:aminopeptidase n=1 Tax=Microbacterium sp. p3-SID336 TaxID=2916212 RepID=UPI0021A8EFA7|nr:aminopeptidase [Microbacterium sp. p3-SID336]MCT1476745.1 aminopeptidase [Microbacterium sp. p3-SID336]